MANISVWLKASMRRREIWRQPTMAGSAPASSSRRHIIAPPRHAAITRGEADDAIQHVLCRSTWICTDIICVFLMASISYVAHLKSILVLKRTVVAVEVEVFTTAAAVQYIIYHNNSWSNQHSALTCAPASINMAAALTSLVSSLPLSLWTARHRAVSPFLFCVLITWMTCKIRHTD